jgi:hypothetical protein
VNLIGRQNDDEKEKIHNRRYLICESNYGRFNNCRLFSAELRDIKKACCSSKTTGREAAIPESFPMAGWA